MVVEQRQSDGPHVKRSASKAEDDVMRLTKENFKLTARLNELQAKLKTNNLNLEDVKSNAPTSIFKRISQRAMTRENKTKLMYGQPCDVKPTGFVDASFKDSKVDEWAESKRKKMQMMMTDEQLANTKDYMKHISSQLQAEKAKRLEIQKELDNMQEY